MSEQKKKRKVAIIASKGTLDMAYPPFLIANTAATMDWDVGIFFTFYGLNMINKKKYKKLKVASLGNPGMPDMKMGPIKFGVPNAMGAIPGMTFMATTMMKRWMKKAHLASFPDMINMAKDLGVKIYGCQMTMDVMGIKRSDLIDGVEDCLGAAGFLDYAADADMTLFV